MLSLKNLVKTYNVKGKVPVRALDGITVDLPETGMVFLLGKSGSGKSTLLNVAGGLDFPTSGELIVDGKSSKYFSQSDYDGYRNAYVGFVFQEYNILEELTVEQNISLALQLQNKPNDKTAVNDILDRVELSGLNKRKPNTLSGGQRQRVAIARALIKNPKIIMADEPTGALDSATGEQIFSVLKELSKNRLILVVSHDKSFAERFGDRIIELSDGKIISDTLVTQTADKPSARNFEVITPETILIRDWSQITQSDFTEMVSLMRKTKSETVITSDKECIYPILNKLDTKKGKPSQAEETKKEAAAVKKSFIKSKLPIKHALKLSLDGIKTKPIRLIFTVLLSIIAFTLFGISTTLMLYEEAYSVSNALADSVYDSVVLNKSYKAYYTQTYLDGREYVKNESSEMLKTAFTQEELDNLNKNEYGLLFAGIMDLGAYDYTADSVGAYQSKRFALDYTLYNEDAYYYCVNSLSGFSDCGEEFLTKNGIFCVVGGYPKDKTEIALPYYIYDYCLHILLSKNVIADANDFPPALLIGQKLGFGGITLTVSGIYNVGNISDKFNELKNKESQLDFLSKKTMAAELYDYLSNSFHTVAFVSKDFYDAHKYDGARIGNAPSFGIAFSSEPIKSSVSEKDNTSIITPRAIWDYGDLIVYYDKSGNKISVTDLEETDIYLPAQTVYYLAYDFYSQLSSPDCNGEPYDELKTILSKFGYDAYYYEKLSSEEFTTLI